MFVLVLCEEWTRSNTAVLERVVDIINEAYTYGEGDIFQEGFQRTTLDEIKELACLGSLLLLGKDENEECEENIIPKQNLSVIDLKEEYRRNYGVVPTGGKVSPDAIIGCIKLVLHGPKPQEQFPVTGYTSSTSDHLLTLNQLKRGEVGMFAICKGVRGQGLGQLLFDVAQQRAKELGCDVCELQLLYPKNRAHPIKDRLRKWYTRNNFSVVARADFEAMFPRIVGLIQEPVCFDIYHKKLK
eukprot:gene6879-9532_t